LTIWQLVVCIWINNTSTTSGSKIKLVFGDAIPSTSQLKKHQNDKPFMTPGTSFLGNQSRQRMPNFE